MKVNDIYHTGGFLKAADIADKGKVKVTISHVGTKDFDEGTKIILAFRNAEKEMVLNKTNAAVIAEILGDDTDNWIGGDIWLYSARVEFGGKIVDALRVVLPAGNITGDGPPPTLTEAVREKQEQATDSDGDPVFSADDDDVPFRQLQSKLWI